MIRGSERGCKADLEHIHAIHQHTRHPKGRPLLVDEGLAIAVAGPRRAGVVHANGPLVVLYHKDARQLVQRGHVQALIELTCGAKREVSNVLKRDITGLHWFPSMYVLHRRKDQVERITSMVRWEVGECPDKLTIVGCSVSKEVAADLGSAVILEGFLQA